MVGDLIDVSIFRGKFNSIFKCVFGRLVLLGHAMPNIYVSVLMGLVVLLVVVVLVEIVLLCLCHVDMSVNKFVEVLAHAWIEF